MGNAGFVIGLAIGLAVGFIVGRKEKPWSALSEKEKKLRMGLVAVGAILFLAGIVVFFLFSS